MKALLTILLFTPLLLLAACGSKEKHPPVSKMEQAKLLPISFGTEIRSLDPRIGIDDKSQLVIKMLFEGLMTFDLQGKLVPSLAKSYKISGNMKTYTFTLRDCNWSNGEPITAYDFEYSWKRAITDTSKSLSIQNFYPIKNVRGFLKKEKSAEELGIRAVDAKTFVVELEHPTAYFLEAVATSSFFPINASLDQKNPDWINEVGPSFISSGPFTLEKHKQNDELVLIKNPAYWDQKNVNLPGIRIAIVKDPTTELSMFEKGQLAWVGKPLSRLPLDAIPSLKTRKELTSVPSMGVYWYFINTEAFPFTNKKIRKAFAYAINRKEITDHILQTGEEPALGVLPKNLGIHPSEHFSDNNLEEARTLLAEGLKELGITKEELGPIVLSYNSSEYHQQTALVVQEQWQKALGIEIKLQQEEWKVHYQNLVSGNYQLGGMGWNSWLRDPIYIMQTFRIRGDGINMSRWESPTYQRLLDEAEVEPDAQKRLHIFFQAEKLLMDEMPVIPIYFTSICYSKKSQLKNVYVSELNQLDFKWASLEE
ncbi:MAG: peptide ABC transporter substrate-binding protein [Chlamydiales bacterium]|nr:peptide ABC transporter substrate-binding protein [Chlamydiales bacterium]